MTEWIELPADVAPGKGRVPAFTSIPDVHRALAVPTGEELLAEEVAAEITAAVAVVAVPFAPVPTDAG